MKVKKIVRSYLRKFKIGQGPYIKLIKSLNDDGYIPMSEVKENDVYIIGFPKSGHTWMQYIITSLVYGISPSLLRDSIVQEFVPDMHVRTFYKRYIERAFIKSHDLPNQSYKNVIYLVRDGRDAMISYYHMLKDIAKPSITLEEMIKDNKGLFPCAWSEHINKWLIENPFPSNIIVIRYEDLLSNPLNELNRLMIFLNIQRDESFCNEIIEHTSIEKLRNKAKTLGLVHKVLNRPDGHNFFRQGKSGIYSNEMPDDLVQLFNKKANMELKYLNYLD